MTKVVKPQGGSVTAMPETIAETVLNTKMSDQEYEALVHGFWPKDMEDRWLMYVEAEWVYLHRSWTGHCVFKARVEVHGNLHVLTTLHINRDVSQYKSTNLGADIDEFNSVLNSLISKNLQVEDHTS
ncbi:hypothetical protein ABDD95_01015 [Mucilaginibacter sp. PAMB04274]|uniref:hypothetical protein n=1 Tax=Mucilaginibacter sp. PAMB04274 TaxID=3138568 RepID=UPI0031F6DAA3